MSSRMVSHGLFVASASLLWLTTANALPCPADRGPLPEAISQWLRTNPEALKLDPPFADELGEVRRNRRALEQGVDPSSITGALQVSGERRIPVLLGKFANTGPDPYPAADLEAQLFGFWPTGTMTDYFKEVSYNQLTVTGDVLDWRTVPQNDTYYEGPPECNGLPKGCGAATDEYIKSLVDQNDPFVDYAQYDNDENGYVDLLVVVHPERGGECGTDNIWSHQARYSDWTGSSFETNDISPVTGEPVRVNNYFVVPAKTCDGGMIEIGVFCHEYTHVFDIPDLYDHGGESAGVGLWCLMGSGNYGGDGDTSSRPLHPCAWVKQQLGWIQSTIVEATQLGAALRASESHPEAFKIFPFLNQGNEYFLIENRQQIGFDSQLPTAGLAIWHVDESITNNEETRHKLVDLEEADGLESLDSNVSSGDAGDLWPGTRVKRTFNDETSPNTKNYDFDETCIAIADISDPAPTMTVTLAPIDACPEHPKCERINHGIILTPQEGKDLSNVTLDEKWKDRARARSRICRDRDADPFWATSGWVNIDDSKTETAHYAEVYADGTSGSYALVKSGITIIRSSAQIEATAVVNSERIATKDGCSRNPQKWRKRAARAKTVGMAKVRASGSVSVSGLRWIGGFGNCKGKNRERQVDDPVDVVFDNLTTGQSVRQRLVTIKSRVWDGETHWTYRITPRTQKGSLRTYGTRAEEARGDGCGDQFIAPPREGALFERILQNTARRMLFVADAGSPAVPPAQHGHLKIVCRNGTVQELEATGIYNYVNSRLTIGQSSTFEIPLDGIRMDIVAPGAPGDVVEITIEGGGGQAVDGLPESVLVEGCELTTGIADGLEDVDTSSPQGADTSLGFEAGTAVQWIAQEFEIPPGGFVLAGTVSLLAYQTGMPVSVPPSVLAVTSKIYDGPPWLPGSQVLFSAVTSGDDLEAEWMDIDRTPTNTIDGGSRPLMELQLWCPDCPEVPLFPGKKWLVLGISGDPEYGPVVMPPCPYPSDTDNAWGYDVAKDSWYQLQDSGSGRAVSFPIDIYGGEPDTTNSMMDCIQTVFLADLGTQVTGEGVRVTWNIRSDFQGELPVFNLYRSEDGVTTKVKVNEGELSGKRKYSVLDQGVTINTRYRYQVEATAADGTQHMAGAVMATYVPSANEINGATGALITLAPNAPNPFRESTWIRFSVRERTPLAIRIFDTAGRLRRTLVDTEDCPAGDVQQAWDGRDDDGELLAAGVYHVRIQTPRESQANRLLVLR